MTPTPSSERRAKLETELARLEAKQAAATGWGAAVGQRHEWIKGIKRQLAAMDAENSAPSSARDAIARIIRRAIVDMNFGGENPIRAAAREKLADEAADAIIAARAPSPSSVEVIEQCAKIADQMAAETSARISEHRPDGFVASIIANSAATMTSVANRIRALPATPAMPAPADAWQHIETAPRDGTPFLCFRPDAKFSAQSGIDLIWYEPSIKTYTMDGDNEVPFAGITHWMPLPMAPVHYGKTK